MAAYVILDYAGEVSIRKRVCNTVRKRETTTNAKIYSFLTMRCRETQYIKKYFTLTRATSGSWMKGLSDDVLAMNFTMESNGRTLSKMGILVRCLKQHSRRTYRLQRTLICRRIWQNTNSIAFSRTGRKSLPRYLDLKKGLVKMLDTMHFVPEHTRPKRCPTGRALNAWVEPGKKCLAIDSLESIYFICFS